MKPTAHRNRSSAVTEPEPDLIHILYMSDSRLDRPSALDQLQTLVETSRRNNAAAQITGALICTEDNFVQFLEGPAAAVQRLLAKLQVDARHANLRILLESPARGRRFGPWTLAYCGPAEFVRAEIDAVTGCGRSGETARARLIDLMVAFAAAAD